MRKVSQKMLWPRVPAEYREELQAVTDGLKAQGLQTGPARHRDHERLSLNSRTTPIWRTWKDALGVPASVPEHCSAFISTGKYTKDGRIVMGHNNWTDYLTAARWNIVFDIVPSSRTPLHQWMACLD